MQSLKEKPVSLAEAREIMEKRQKEGELSYEQQNTLDYLQQFSYLPVKKAKDLAKQLKALDCLTEAQIALLVNILPGKPTEIKVVLGVETEHPVSEDQVKEITALIKKFKPSKA
ncbi:MAG: RNA polymerase Rpb4 family protein [Candidatus Micrarchaeia archaeon]